MCRIDLEDDSDRTMPNLYETDFFARTQAQAELLRHQQWHHFDLPNLIDEIESLGRQQRQELRSRLSMLNCVALSSPNIVDDSLRLTNKLKRVEFGSRSPYRTYAIALTVLENV